MRVPRFVISYLERKFMPLAAEVPDELIGHHMRSRNKTGHINPPAQPFLRRWFVIPKNRFMNIYLHQFIRNDEDRALYDHPWLNLSIFVRGSYIEHKIDKGGVHRRTIYSAGAIKMRSPWAAHRVELTHKGDGGPLPSWSLF